MFNNPNATPPWMEEPPDPFFDGAEVIGQFRRQSFFCVRCSRREAPPLHYEGVCIRLRDSIFAIDFRCAAQLGLTFTGKLLSEGMARRILPIVRYRQETPLKEQAPAL
jgi:hypothetical protein